MLNAEVAPTETLIIEDSYNGRLGASKTGSYIYGVNSPKDIHLESIVNFIERLKEKKVNKWKDNKLNILIILISFLHLDIDREGVHNHIHNHIYLYSKGNHLNLHPSF